MIRDMGLSPETKALFKKVLDSSEVILEMLVAKEGAEVRANAKGQPTNCT